MLAEYGIVTVANSDPISCCYFFALTTFSFVIFSQELQPVHILYFINVRTVNVMASSSFLGRDYFYVYNPTEREVFQFAHPVGGAAVAYPITVHFHQIKLFVFYL